MNLPNKLRLTKDGEIVLDTGESAKEYLKEYALRLNISSDEPMSLVPRDTLNRLIKDADSFKEIVLFLAKGE